MWGISLVMVFQSKPAFILKRNGSDLLGVVTPWQNGSSKYNFRSMKTDKFQIATEIETGTGEGSKVNTLSLV